MGNLGVFEIIIILALIAIPALVVFVVVRADRRRGR